MRKRNDPMLFITKHKVGYRIKIPGYDHGHLFSCVIYKYEHGTYAKAKKYAMEARDKILQELEDDRIYSTSWTEAVTYFINGLGLEVNDNRVCARTPNDKGLPQTRRFGYGTRGLRDAFDMTIQALEEYKREAVYPDWVIEEAWKRIERNVK